VRTATVGRRFVEALVSIHAVVARDVGLGDLGRPEGFLARQVRRWKKQLDASYSRHLVGADELYEKLAQSVPTTDAPAAIVHGDYRLDNLLFDDADQVAAVVDWEMATLGDPLTDVGLILAYEHLASLDGTIGNACAAPGFLTWIRPSRSIFDHQRTDARSHGASMSAWRATSWRPCWRASISGICADRQRGRASAG
jgi:aminoglycoside phosphotransferase (APT) family kinase protein